MPCVAGLAPAFVRGGAIRQQAMAVDSAEAGLLPASSQADPVAATPPTTVDKWRSYIDLLGDVGEDEVLNDDDEEICQVFSTKPRDPANQRFAVRCLRRFSSAAARASRRRLA